MSLQRYLDIHYDVQSGVQNYNVQKVELIIKSSNYITGELSNNILKIRHIFSDKWPHQDETELYISYNNYIVDSAALSQNEFGSDITSLLSLFFRKKFSFVGLSRLDDIRYNPYKKRKYIVDPALTNIGSKKTDNLSVDYSSPIKINEFKTFFDKVIEYHSKAKFEIFLQSVRRYNYSLQIIDTEPELAFISLISAIEVLSNRQKIKLSFSDLGSSWQNIGKLIDKNIDDEAVRNDVKNNIIRNQHSIHKEFKHFVLKYLPEEFLEQSDSEIVNLKADKNDIEKYLKAIYDQRSKTLHKGIPFPHTSWNLHEKCDIPQFRPGFELGKPITKKRIKELEYLPTLMFIERMVNSVPKNYFKI